MALIYDKTKELVNQTKLLQNLVNNGIQISSNDPNGVVGNQPLSGVDDNNSTNATLGSEAVFTGNWSNISSYSGITILVDGTSAGTADGTLEMQFSHDTITVHRNISIPVADITSVAPRTLGVVAKYFRIVYTNGLTAHTSTDIQTMFHTEQVQLVSRLDQSLIGTEDVSNVRAVFMGQTPENVFVNNKLSGQAFLSTSNLLNGFTYDSGPLDMRRYTQVQTEVLASHDGSLTFTFYSDAGTNVVRSLTIPYTASSGFQFFAAPTFGYYVRYQFLNNSGSNQTNFYFTTKFTDTSVNGQIVTLGGNLASAMTANVGRNVIVGQKVDESFLNVGLTDAGELLTNTLASNRQTRGVYNGGTISADTYAILVDISAEPFTSYTSIDTIEMTCNLSGNNSTCNIKIGVITRIDGTDADISWLITSNFSTANANNYLIFTKNYQPSAIQFRSSGGSLVNAHTNDTSASVAAVNTGITLASPRGNITPAINDVIILFDHTGTNFDSIVSTVYHTD
jgi:hypothetical protein